MFPPSGRSAAGGSSFAPEYRGVFNEICETFGFAAGWLLKGDWQWGEFNLFGFPSRLLSQRGFRWPRRSRVLGWPMPRPHSFTWLLLLAFALAPREASAELIEQSFEREVTATLSLRYLLSVPEGYDDDPEARWPLVVFLHGAGERGDDLSKAGVHGPPKAVAEGASFPFILVAPQCPADEWWTDQPVLELIDHLEESFRVDASRIYLTGLSMGGYGTWHFATAAPHRFAAVAPVCGGGVPYQMRRIPHLPVWAFHGDEDRAVPVEESVRLVEALRRHGNESAKLTLYEGVGHDSWTETYANPELYEWLLSHSLPETEE